MRGGSTLQKLSYRMFKINYWQKFSSYTIHYEVITSRSCPIQQTKKIAYFNF